MNGKKAKALRRLARAAADPTQPAIMVKRRRGKTPEGEAFFRDTHFAPAGSFRNIYQELKRGSGS